MFFFLLPAKKTSIIKLVQVVAGRSFVKSDTANEIVVNETLVSKVGLKDPNEVVGKEMRTGRSNW